MLSEICTGRARRDGFVQYYNKSLSILDNRAEKMQVNGIKDPKDGTFISSITTLQKEVSLLRQDAGKWQHIA